ncbi:MAG: CARDB domain-containing protein, partial [Candidatus Brocadiaceae bacterium]
ADGPFFNKSTEKARMGDFIRFLAETQRSYYEQRRSRMHSLGWQGVAVSTAWQAGGPAAQAANLWADDAMDAVSRHTYVGGGAGGHYVAEGAVNNSTHLDQPGQGILAGYSYGSDGLTVPLYQVEDKPAIKTEWNQNPPNQWRAEIAPLYAFYGMGLQGWDGSTHFTGGRLWMENGWPGAGRGPSSYVSETPLYMGQFPALSFAVYNGHIQEGELAAARRMGVEAIFQGIDVLSQDLAGGGFPGESSLYTPPEVGAIGRLTFKAGDGLEVSDSSKTDWDLYWDQPNEVITSMTGELIWDYGDRVVTVRGSRTQAVIGFAGGGHFDLPGVTVDVTTPFVSLLFTPLDNEPLIESEHILVTALAQDRQMGTEYSGDGSELLELGGPPLLLQPVEASITFKGADLLSARVVDVLGVPTETDVEAAGNTITIDGRYQTYYYEVRREPARPQPDLRVTDVSGPSQMTVDGAASVPVALQNDGSAASGAFEVGVFLSADEQYDGGDLLVASQGVSALPAGGSWSESVPVDLGAVPGAQTGFYHWIACADHLDAVEESNEGNNWLAGNGVSVQPEPLPDLTMASVDGPRHVYLDGSGEVAVTVENAGEGDAGASSLRLFLSSDGQYGPGDIELGSLTVPGIAGGDTWSGSVPFDLGATPGEETGDYYWIACVDPDDAVQESAEDNNWDAGNAVYVALSHSWRSGPVRVTIFDTAGAGAVDPDDFQVKFGNGGVKAIKLSGSRSMVGLGVTISGASSVGSIKDGRKGVPGQLAFIASDASIGKLKLKSGMTGYDLNAETLGGLAFPADVDGDGQSDDATAIYCEGTIGKFQFDGGVGGDIYIGGGGISLGKAKNNSGGYHGDLVTTGGIGKLQLGGSFGSSIRTGGSVGKFQLKDGAFGGTLMVSGHLGKLDVKGADVLAGARVRIGGELGKLGIKGSIRGAAGPDGTVQILAGAIGKVTVKGSVQNARILAGADLGEDWAVGGTGVDADTFRQGRLDKISIKGSVADSLIGAGLTSGGAGLDLDWLSANETFLDGSEIGKVNIKGSLTSSAATGMPFGIGSYRVGKVKVGRDREHPLVVTEV